MTDKTTIRSFRESLETLEDLRLEAGGLEGDILDALPRMRKKIGVTQAQMGKIIGLSRQYYADLELRRRRITDNVLNHLLECDKW